MAEEKQEKKERERLPGREFGDVLASIAEFQARQGMEHSDLLLFLSLVDLLAVLNLLHRRWESSAAGGMPAGATDLVSQALRMLPGRGNDLLNLLAKDGNLASLASAILKLLQPPAIQQQAGTEKAVKETPSRDVVRWDFGKR